MDKKILVENINKLIDSFKKEDKTFSFVGLIPVYPGYEKTSYILMVGASWLDMLPATDRISIITRRMFDILDNKTLRAVNRVEIYDENKQTNVLSDDLVFEDTIGFKEFLNSQRRLLSYQIQ